MVKYTFLTLFAALVLFSHPVSAADKNAPAIPIEQALKIAQDYLQQKGVAGPFIAGLTLEKATPKTSYWWARWSSSISDGKKTESGLRIDMDGSITRFVTGSDGAGSAGSPTGPFEAPQGQRRVGARNIR